MRRVGSDTSQLPCSSALWSCARGWIVADSLSSLVAVIGCERHREAHPAKRSSGCPYDSCTNRPPSMLHVNRSRRNSAPALLTQRGSPARRPGIRTVLLLTVSDGFSDTT